MSALSPRLYAARRASLTHLSASVLVALLCATLVFGVWYPHPFDQLVGGRELFLLMISVDVICGPLLTLVVFSPTKSRRELWLDIGLIVIIQLAALAYGLQSTMRARPVFVGFEGDRFRVVAAPDIDEGDIDKAPPELRDLSLNGPLPLGVRLAKAGDPDFLASVQASVQGRHPAFRPERWVEYDRQREAVLAVAKPLASLIKKQPREQQDLIASAVASTGLAEQQLGFLPLIAGRHTDWVVLIDLKTADFKAYVHVDGWGD